MNVLLFQVDGKIPNLALMRLSTWHKQKGDVIEFLNSTNDLWFTQADRVYASSIFDFIMHVTQGVSIDLLHNLRERSIDLIVGRIPDLTAEKDLSIEILFEDPQFVVVGPKNSLVKGTISLLLGAAGERVGSG